MIWTRCSELDRVSDNIRIRTASRLPTPQNYDSTVYLNPYEKTCFKPENISICGAEQACQPAGVASATLDQTLVGWYMKGGQDPTACLRVSHGHTGLEFENQPKHGYVHVSCCVAVVATQKVQHNVSQPFEIILLFEIDRQVGKLHLCATMVFSDIVNTHYSSLNNLVHKKRVPLTWLCL